MNSPEQRDFDPMDRFLERSIENWLSQENAPRDGRARLLKAAGSQPSKKQYTWLHQLLRVMFPDPSYAGVPTYFFQNSLIHHPRNSFALVHLI